MLSRFACVAIVSLSMLSPSSAFRVKPKRKNEGGNQVSKIELRQKARATLNGNSMVSTLESSVSAKGDPAPAPAPPPSTDGAKVLSLGDSYSSGVGIHRSANQYEGGDCWRDWRTTPGAVFAADNSLPFVNKACSGGVAADIHQQFEELKASHPGDAQTGFAGSTILFTIGGNDLQTYKGETWPGLLTSCILSFYGACHEKQENQIANWDELQATVTEFYTKLAQDAPNARIRVLGYPRLLQRKVFCIAVPLLNYGAADWADRQVDELNRRLRLATNEVRDRFAPTALAQEAGQGGGQEREDKLRQKATAKLNGTALVSTLDGSLSRKGDPAPAPAPPPPPSSVDIEFVDVSSFFSRGACRVFRREVNTIVLDGFSLSDSSFHPSQRGYNKYYEALADSAGLMMSAASKALPEDDLPDHESFQHMLEGWDTNKDGKLDIGECLVMAAPSAGDGEQASPEVDEQGRAFFQQADKDNDDYLNLAEFEEFSALVEAAEEATTTTTTTTTLGPVIVGVQSWSGEVVSDRPAGYLPEDTNDGHGFWSKFVYVKARVEVSAFGCSGFEFRRSEDEMHFDRSTGDLAERSGGDYRYLVPVGTVAPEFAVKRVWWQEGGGNNGGNCTGDINEGRGGRYLYFCWSH